jgi:hypothetical protein
MGIALYISFWALPMMSTLRVSQIVGPPGYSGKQIVMLTDEHTSGTKKSHVPSASAGGL